MLEKKSKIDKETDAKVDARTTKDLPPPYEEVAGVSHIAPQYNRVNTPQYQLSDQQFGGNQGQGNYYPVSENGRDFINNDPVYNFGVNTDPNRPIVIPGNPQPVAPADAPLQQQVRPMHNTHLGNNRRTYPGKMNASYSAQYSELQRKKQNGEYKGP